MTNMLSSIKVINILTKGSSRVFGIKPKISDQEVQVRSQLCAQFSVNHNSQFYAVSATFLEHYSGSKLSNGIELILICIYIRCKLEVNKTATFCHVRNR